MMPILHAIGVVVVAGLGIATWRIRCEGFGCVGVGLAWVAWSCVFALWLAVGLLALRSTKGRPGMLRIGRYSIAAQLAVGLVALGYWAIRNTA
ncbi:hypothetical protein [uncultured Dechloromonas sp.]|uniref:hypothetical protein n=1 Tax=uncultured Dechloromonas sp. TaxID=171719 RepID=UPI0025E0C979|nr:hypothetical protein [uncultured Dechloromonas sp.]